MTCPNCGTKYKGKQCPECGRWTTDFETAWSNRWKYGLLGGAAVLLVTVFAIIWATHGTNQFFDELENQVNGTSGKGDQDYTFITSEPSDSTNLEKHDALRAEILDTAVSLGLPDTLEVGIVADRAEISVPTDYTQDTIPDGWDTVKETAISACNAIQEAVSDYDILIYYKDINDNILLTILNGSISHDAFDGSEPVVYNEPTISLAEFDQIKTGMSYDEVVKIVGGLGQILSQADLGLGSEYASVMYMWEGEGMVGANANVMFQGGEVVSKSQFGLE